MRFALVAVCGVAMGALACALAPGVAHAHTDVYLAADQGRVVVGSYDWALRMADAPSDVVAASIQYEGPTTAHTSNPGFTSLGSSLDIFTTLPPLAQVRIMLSSQPKARRLWYAAADSQFSFVPVDDEAEQLSLVDPWGLEALPLGASVGNGDATLMLGTTNADGQIHEHGEFVIDGQDGLPRNGIYAAVVQFEVEGLMPSDPVAIVLMHGVDSVDGGVLDDGVLDDGVLIEALGLLGDTQEDTRSDVGGCSVGGVQRGDDMQWAAALLLLVCGVWRRTR